LTSGNVLFTGDGVIALPEVRECIEWICAETAAWIKASFRYSKGERILRT
jgi:hypothetical protein